MNLLSFLKNFCIHQNYHWNYGEKNRINYHPRESRARLSSTY